MGKAQIIEDLGSGQYRVLVHFDQRNTALRLALIAETLDKLNTTYITQLLNNDPKWKVTELKIRSLEKERDQLQFGVPQTMEHLTWACDFSEGLTGEVGTVESHGEVGGSPFQIINVRPGYNEGSPYNGSRDGVIAMGPEQAPWQWFFNHTMLPGWQKEGPIYRVGKIIYIDKGNDTCHVEMDDMVSSAQALNIIPEGKEILNDVPIEYMQCNAQALEVDDRVIVEFRDQSWTGEKVVIGFESNPRPCPVYLQASINGNTCTFFGGGKRIRIQQQNPETSQWETVEEQNVQTSKEGLVGPFLNVDISRPFTAELYFRSNSWYIGRPLYWFQFWQVGSPGDYDLHLKYGEFRDISQGTWMLNDAWKQAAWLWDADQVSGGIFDGGHEDELVYREWYLKRVEWNMSDEGNNILSNGAVELDLGDGEVYRVFPVNFTCKGIRHRRIEYPIYDQIYYWMNCMFGGRGTDQDVRANPYGGPVPQPSEPWSPGFGQGEVPADYGWMYMGSFLGDNTDGQWDTPGSILRESWYPGGYQQMYNIYNLWSTNNLEHTATGDWLLSWTSSSNMGAFPGILTLDDGTIQYEPPKCVIKVCNHIQWIVAYCVDWDLYGDCIQGEPMCGCSGSGGSECVQDDHDRHTWEYEVAELHPSLC